MAQITEDHAEQLLDLLFAIGKNGVESVNSGTAVTVSDSTVASVTALTLNGVTPVITLPTPSAGKRKVLYLIQDATGTRIPSWVTPSGAIRWVGAAAPTLSTAAGKTDRVIFDCFDGTNWVGTPSLNIS